MIYPLVYQNKSSHLRLYTRFQGNVLCFFHIIFVNKNLLQVYSYHMLEMSSLVVKEYTNSQLLSLINSSFEFLCSANLSYNDEHLNSKTSNLLEYFIAYLVPFIILEIFSSKILFSRSTSVYRSISIITTGWHLPSRIYSFFFF